MLLVAKNTIQTVKVIRPREPSNPQDFGQSQTILFKPGAEFESDDYGISEAEVSELISAGVARPKDDTSSTTQAAASDELARQAAARELSSAGSSR